MLSLSETLPVLHQSPEVNVPRVVHAGAWQAAQGQDFAPHSHGVWELVYYRDGHVRCPVGSDVYTARAGTLLCTPPGTTHSEVAVSAYRNFWILVDAPQSAWPVHMEDDAAQSIGHVCAALVREQREPDTTEREAMQTLLLAQLDLLVRRSARRQAEHVPPAETAVRHAERWFAEAFPTATIADAARIACVSPSTLRAAFQACRGQSPRAALAQVRLRHALTLLRTSDLTLDAIARRCGYDSGAHLSRHVKKATGQTPGQQR